MLNLSSTLKRTSKEKEYSINNSNIKENSISGSIISDTSPVYLFCTNKNGINSKNENGWTPIYRAIIANNLLALNELLNLGSDPNISNNLGETPLYLCIDIDNYDALIILLQYNADTNIAKRNGTTPLHLATKKNKENFMHALLRNKANPNLSNKLYSQTPTHIAIINKVSEEMLKIFYEYNADIYNIKDKYDKTPFDYAKELKDEDYVHLLIQIFGDKNNGKDSKQSKTLNINKIPETIEKKNDKILNIPFNLHNSNYNQLPNELSINGIEEKENKIKEIITENRLEINEGKNNDIKEQDKIFLKEENKEKNYNNKNSEKKTEKFGILSSGDALYSDRSFSNANESNKSKKDSNKSEMKKNNLSEFQPVPFITENNEIKQKNSIIKSLKNNINIDTKMIDNSKDIIFLNNDNNDSNNFIINENNKINIEQKKEKIKNSELNLDFLNNNKKIKENIGNNINGINESNEEHKIKENNNTDKEIIKNIISSTVKKIKVNTNTYSSEFSSLNKNSSVQNNNNSNTKVEVVKLINFSSNNNSNEGNFGNKLSNNTNLDNYINLNSELENGTSSFILYNSKKTDNGQKNNILTQNKINEMITCISNKKIDNQTNNANTFNEMKLDNLTSNSNNQIEAENSNKELQKYKVDQKAKQQELKPQDKNLINDKKENNENINNNIQLTTNSNDNILFDGSLEYSKSKSYIINEVALNNQNQNNNNLSNINNGNNIFSQHHRQISYHNNKASINKRKKDGDFQNEENSIHNKENDNDNNNEIIYYNKNYLAGNNSAKKFETNFIEPKNLVIQKNSKIKAHTQSDLNTFNIQRYNSITNKTNSINKKIFTYTSPNINKNIDLIKNNLINNDKENIDLNNNNNLNTNPNVNISNLNGTKEELFSINNNLSSILNTNKFESVKGTSNNLIGETNNNSTFNVFDDIVEIKNLEKKVDLYSEKRNSINNTNNDYNKKFLKNEGKLRNNFRGSSMGNTTFSSLTKNIANQGKQSISSTINNNNINASNIILSGKNSSINNINQSCNIIKNIPVNMLLRLRDWLISCDLLCYYNLLIENQMYDIDKCITDIQNSKLKIGYKDIEDLGIRKPGHIFRLLLKLEIDAGILDNNLFNFILSKFNLSSSISNNIILTSSVSDINCCGMCNKNPNNQSFMKRSDFPYNDILSFLKYKDLWKYKENFLHNGFDQLEYILLQLFSRYTFDKELMNDCFHLYNEKDKLDVLNKLYQEKIIIANECGIESNIKEINQILSNYSCSSKFSSKKKNYYSSENTLKDTNENNYCYIF